MAMQPGHAGQSPMGPGPIPSQQMMHMQHQQQQQQMAQQQQQQGMPPGPHPPGHQQGPPNPQGPSSMAMSEQSKDNISKAKFLVPQLKETLMDVMKQAANTINANNMIDSGLKSVEIDPSRFDKSLEKFFSICDQMEVHLKTSIECLNQGVSSSRYLPTPVTPTKMEGSLTYPQYINVVKGQIAFAKEVHDILTDASQKMSE